MLTLYGDIISGNCYKVYLLLHLLQKKHNWVNIDIMQGQAATDKFRVKNPNAKIPVLELDNGETLAESNAILCYLAEDTEYLPEESWQKAKVMEWLFFEQYSHEPFIAVARFINKYQGLPDTRRSEYEMKQPGGHKALSIMENRLQSNEYLVADHYTIADIALYAYTHVADEGGFDLSRYPAIQAWIQRIQSHPRHIGMQLKPEHCE